MILIDKDKFVALVESDIQSYRNFILRNKEGHENDSVTKEYARKEQTFNGRQMANKEWNNSITGLQRALEFLKDCE